jgi:hypothetical protein
MTVCEDVKKDLPQVKTLTELSAADLQERGFIICAKYGRYHAGPYCEGAYCGVVIKDCKDGRAVGSFHTHPTLHYMADFFSSADLDLASAAGYKFTCIGYREGEKTKLRCTTIPEKPLPGESSAFTRALSEAHYETVKYKNKKEAFEKDFSEGKLSREDFNRRYEELVMEYSKIRDRLRSLEVEPCEVEL